MSRDSYVPWLSPLEHAQIRSWHDRAYRRLTDAEDTTWRCLGFELFVPAGVFPPVDAETLGAAVLAATRAGMRVLDLGTGSGINALAAASAGATVVATDINAAALQAAKANAERNHLTTHISFLNTDLYDDVDERFDLIVFNPPYRWFRPRTIIEAACADENYNTLRRFAAETPSHLAPEASALVSFGTSGDYAYFRSLIDPKFAVETVSSTETTQDEDTVSYFVHRLTPNRPKT